MTGTYTATVMLASYYAVVTRSPTLTPALNITTAVTFKILYSNPETSTNVPYLLLEEQMTAVRPPTGAYTALEALNSINDCIIKQCLRCTPKIIVFTI